tara:strand:- start:4867 stop:5277 length:411 start_codon:yes stop_codon:yes gene_type:complete
MAINLSSAEQTRVKKTRTINSSTTLEPSDSGKVIFVTEPGDASQVITFPTERAGLNFKFICSVDLTNTITIDSPTDANIFGEILVAGATVPAADEDNIKFVGGAADQGDYVEFECDGTNWYVTGAGAASGSITANT